MLLVLKTRKSKLAALEKLVLAKHPYDTPEFLVLPVSAGNKKYLDWLASCTKCPRVAQVIRAGSRGTHASPKIFI